jgi:SAM-dependent methyltransferase
VNTPADVNFRSDLAAVHHRGFGFHAAVCAPGIVDFLAPVRARRGLVLELGCGTGLLTRELVAAGYRVIATDAAPAMLDIARDVVGESAQEVRQLTLPETGCRRRTRSWPLVTRLTIYRMLRQSTGR